MQEGPGQEEAQRHRGSRVLHTLVRWAARPSLALGVVAADFLWVLYSAVFGFPARLEVVFQTLVAATTLAMVFVIQHTQARAEEATQRKLDEILSCLPGADGRLVRVETASPGELDELEERHDDLRRAAVREGG